MSLPRSTANLSWLFCTSLWRLIRLRKASGDSEDAGWRPPPWGPGIRAFRTVQGSGSGFPGKEGWAAGDAAGVSGIPARTPSPSRDTIRPDTRLRGETKAEGWAHRPRPPPRERRATRLTGPRRRRQPRRPRPVTSRSRSEGRRARQSAGRAGLSPSGPPGPGRSAARAVSARPRCRVP